MAARQSYANGVPKIDTDAWRLDEYKEEMAKKYRKDNEALFKETKEWCTKYRCPYGPVKGFFVKMLDQLLNLLLTVIYAALDAIMDVFFSTVGTVAKLTDSIIIVGCYLLFWSSAATTCCKKSTIINAIMDFIQDLCDGALEIVKKIIETWYKLLGIKDRLEYECDCERIEATLQEDYKEELEMARQATYNKYDNYVAVMTMPKEPAPGTYYLNVRRQSEAVDEFFKRHVEATISMYNKWPYAATDDCPAAINTRMLAFVSWKEYARFLVSNWLSTANMWSLSNDTGYMPEQHKKQMDYCADTMPKELYYYVLSLISDTETAAAEAKKEAKIG